MIMHPRISVMSLAAICNYKRKEFWFGKFMSFLFNSKMMSGCLEQAFEESYNIASKIERPY